MMGERTVRDCGFAIADCGFDVRPSNSQSAIRNPQSSGV